MNRHVNAIAGRLSLRPPQRESLEILDRVMTIAPPKKDMELGAALAAIQSEFPSVSDFEREFPSLCFSLATGVGKTRLMGAFISYLHLAHGYKDFFVLAPSLTIYNKLITDFKPNTPKYVFPGIAEFANQPPTLITGDSYEGQAGTLFDALTSCRINIFNISKINSEVRGGRSPRIKRLSEYIGESYFEYLAGLPNLVLLMDESHRYRGSAGVRAINELKPVLGLELTATPLVEAAKGPIPFKNVIYSYPLARAMADGFVKEPAVVTRKNFNPAGMSAEALERLKLEDGIWLHERMKIDLATYAQEAGKPLVKPFLLVIARDTTHARELLQWIQSEECSGGRYREKVLQVDSSQRGADEEKMIADLLTVEEASNPIEIVIHVNMLKEGWDVTNLYTIVPLRAANARILIEQSIGRGLRLPYGRRIGRRNGEDTPSLDRLSIVAHDRFQEIVDEARRPGSVLQLAQEVLDPAVLKEKTILVASPPRIETSLGIQASLPGATLVEGVDKGMTVFTTPVEQELARVTYEVIRRYESRPRDVPSAAHLQRPEIQAAIVKAVTEQFRPPQLELTGVIEAPPIAAVVARTTALVVQQTIDIPRVLVVPQGEVRSGFRPFQLDCATLRYPAVADHLVSQLLRSGEQVILTMDRPGSEESRLENYVVAGLVDFNDVSYDDQADLLYDLARQAVSFYLSYLTPEEVRGVLRYHQRDIAKAIHAQMQGHYWQEALEYETRISRGFTSLKPSAYSAGENEPVLDFRMSPPDKSNMARYLFDGFERCLYAFQKFDSDAERKLAVILERESSKWFKPAGGQFQIYYREGADHPEYQPDFVADVEGSILMLEPKASNQMEDPIVLTKRTAATTWCMHASEHAATYGGKPWRYALIPHGAISENMSLLGLVEQFGS